MSGRLDGRVIIVTGGAQGLGRAYAHRLATAGARVAVADIDERRAADTVAAIGEDRAFGVPTDVTDDNQVVAMVEAVVDRWGTVTGLINNAGGSLYPTVPFETVGRPQWDHVIAVNLTSQFLCARAVVSSMRSAGYGKIVNICSSTLAHGLPTGMTPYIAAKGGVLGFTRALSHELGSDNICVNAVAPGFVQVDTPKAVHTAESASRLVNQMIRDQAIHRAQTPEDLCGTVEFLCSADSDFVTGQVVAVDGGWSHV